MTKKPTPKPVEASPAKPARPAKPAAKTSKTAATPTAKTAARRKPAAKTASASQVNRQAARQADRPNKRQRASKATTEPMPLSAAPPAQELPPAAAGQAPPAADPAADGLTPKQRRFVEEYLIDLNGSRAYRRAFPAAAEPTARNEAAQLLKRPEIKAAVAAAMRGLAQRAAISADEVVRRLAMMATADERELMEVRVGCCRYCWGEGYRFQRTPAEFERAMDEHSQAIDRGEDVGIFDERGGSGFNGNHEPNPDCPECFGDGKVRPVFKDTRHLSEGAAMLFAGVKETKDGFEIKTHSRADALVNLGRHYGIFNDKIKLGGEVKVDATEELMEFLRGRSSRLPLARDDDGELT